MAPATTVPTAPATPVMPKLPEPNRVEASAPATVVVKAPADVRVTVNGQLAMRNGTEESFTTPTLQPEQTYAYEFKAEAVRDGHTVTRTRRVFVWAGRTSRVDFNDLKTEAEGPGDNSAKVTVVVPADAQLWVDGVPVPATAGKQRSFDTPKLKAGLNYFYTLTAEVNRDGQKRSARRRVNVAAGKQVTVEFNELLPVQSARR